MQKNLLLSFAFTCALLASNLTFAQNTVKTKEKKLTKKEVAKIRKQHEYHLANNKVNKHFNIPRSQRKAEGLPPNQYFEQEWLLTMNPSRGYPTGENLDLIRKDLEQARREALSQRIPGDANNNNWIERGPNNVGGRTRAIVFDPTDVNLNTVIAGGVSGGLWKNTNISSAASTWSKIDTFPEHVNVQNIVIDPNNTNIWYVGTGESYVQGDVNGNGIWKSTDKGVTWARVFGGGTVTTTVKKLNNLDIVAPSSANTINQYSTGVASWSGGAVVNAITAPIVLMNDGTAPTEDACSATTQNYTGKIVLIRRGTCSFESKSVVAQNAGAVAVIIMNNAAGGGVFNMAEDSTVAGTIPTIMISKEDGDLLVANLGNLTGTIKPSLPTEFAGTEVTGVSLVNDLVIKNNGGNSEIIVAIGDGIYADSRNGTLFGSSNYGVYKSVNGGSTWTKLILPTLANGHPICPNDIEIATNGNIWVSSTNSNTFGDGGGRVYQSTDNGTTFTLKYTVTGYASGTKGTGGVGTRVEIEASNTNANTLYILSQIEGMTPNATSEVAWETKLEKTTDAFATTPTQITLPTSVYSSALTKSREYISGFTGYQAFFDLMIESSPTNDATIFIGGIDLYRSTNSGSTWSQISRWQTNVHSDQHALTFKPGNSDIGVFGNDGGVYYCGALGTASGASTTAITTRNNGFNVTQFVGVAVMPNGVSGAAGDFFVAGAQDNGTQYFSGSTAGETSTAGASVGVNGTYEVQGGDGGKPLFDQGSDKYYITNYTNNNNMYMRTVGSTNFVQLDDDTNGMGLFYAAMCLDSTNDIVYSDFTDATNRIYQIRRYSGYNGGTVTRTNLTNALLTTYPTALATGKITPTILYAGTMNGKLLKITSANGANPAWSDITGPQFVGSVSDIEFGANDNQIFVTMHNFGVNNIWYTTDGGANWFRLDGNLPDLPVKCILQNPLNTAEIMIGTELGVWYANTFNPATAADQALDWKQSFNGMSNVKVTDLDLQANSPTAPTAYKVYAATYGRGVFSGTLTATLSNPKNEIANKGIKVFPTVSKGNVTIASDKAYGASTIELFDITGKKVYNNNIEINSNSQEVSFGTQSSGTYILKISGNGFEGTQKLIIE